MSPLYKTLAVILLTLCCTSARASKVIDSITRQPIVAAGIMDRNGTMLGMTDKEGSFGKYDKVSYPLTIRCLGYEPAVIDSESETITMYPVAYELPEAVISMSDREIMMQLCYAREYTSVITDKDTITIFSEAMVDYLIPLKEKLKKFKGRTSPRVLAQRNIQHYKLKDGTDSISTRLGDESSFLWIQIMNLPSKPFQEPSSMRGVPTATDTLHGKYSIKSIINKNPRTFTRFIYFLADKKDHKWSPLIFKLLGLTIDITECVLSYVYTTDETGLYGPAGLLYSSQTLDAECKGKFFKKMAHTKNPVSLKSYIELYPVSSSIMTASEAKEYNRTKPSVDFTIPSSVTPLDDATLQLIEKAKERATVQQ